MFRVMGKDGTVLGFADKVEYVKAVAPGCYRVVPEAEADGFMFRATPYSLTDRTLAGAVGEASVSEADSGDELERQQGQIDSVGAFVYADQHKRWDGLKWVYDPENPIPLLRFPFPVEPNAVYRVEDGTRYVGVKAGSVTPETLEEFLEPYELEET